MEGTLVIGIGDGTIIGVAVIGVTGAKVSVGDDIGDGGTIVGVVGTIVDIGDGIGGDDIGGATVVILVINCVLITFGIVPVVPTV